MHALGRADVCSDDDADCTPDLVRHADIYTDPDDEACYADTAADDLACDGICYADVAADDMG